MLHPLFSLLPVSAARKSVGGERRRKERLQHAERQLIAFLENKGGTIPRQASFKNIDDTARFWDKDLSLS